MVIRLFGGGPMGRRATWRLRRARALSSGDALSVAALRGRHRIRNADFEPEKFTAMKRAPRRRGRFSCSRRRRFPCLMYSELPSWAFAP